MLFEKMNGHAHSRIPFDIVSFIVVPSIASYVWLQKYVHRETFNQARNNSHCNHTSDCLIKVVVSTDFYFLKPNFIQNKFKKRTNEALLY